MYTGGPEALAELAVRVQAPAPDDTLAFKGAFLSDRAGSFFYDALAQEAYDPAMGFIAGGFRMLDGWRWWSVDDSVAVGPQDRREAAARPDFIVRRYVFRDSVNFATGLINTVRGFRPFSITERISMLDTLGAVIVQVPDSIGTVTFIPTFSDRPDRDGYTVTDSAGVLLIGRSNYSTAPDNNPRPVWLAITVPGDGRVERRWENLGVEGTRTRVLTPARITFRTPGAIILTHGRTPEDAIARAQLAAGRIESGLEQRSQRMAALLEQSFIRTQDQDFNRAFGWARLSTDALTIRDSARTVLASGIPGTPLRPGRSQLQALGGALLATGDWERAREVVTAFGSAQRFDRRIDVFGRAPTEFALGEVGRAARYLTTDATPIFVATVGDYVRTTGDVGLVNPRYWTNTVFATRGTFDVHARDGLLRVPQNQTWMRQQDAGSALVVNRGESPIEVQGSYYRQLLAMNEFSRIMGVPRQGQSYRDSLELLQTRFAERFVIAQDSLLRDHAQAQTALRPNALLALKDMDLDPILARGITRQYAERLAYSYGVSTLAQSDSAFHPYLVAPEFYEPDRAAYNGTVWTWLSGPLVSLMTRYGATQLAYEQTVNLYRLMLDEGVVGAIADNVDGHPWPDLDRPLAGGAPVQPWTLAEFLRNAYEDYAGITYVTAGEVLIEPRLPSEWGETTTRFRLGNGFVTAVVRMDRRGTTLELSPEGVLPNDARARVRAGGIEKVVSLSRSVGDTLNVAAAAITLEFRNGTVLVESEEQPADARYQVWTSEYWTDFSWAVPDIRTEYPVLQRIEQERQLRPDQILQANLGATVILTRTDPMGDDWGANSNFSYPGAFPPGVMDAIYLEIAEDDSTHYFRVELANLVPVDSLGYPSTMLALAINTGEGGETRIGRGADYTLPASGGYNYIIWVGDGILIEDDRGRELGRLDASASDFYDIEDATVQFALPKFVIPRMARGTRVTLLVGARTPGGALGDFRSVRDVQTADHGGGRIERGLPNVYDVIVADVVRR
ncbi:hypothetical protein BH23BAC4_BH23BAC4_10100 [soil metagenome]